MSRAVCEHGIRWYRHCDLCTDAPNVVDELVDREWFEWRGAAFWFGRTFEPPSRSREARRVQAAVRELNAYETYFGRVERPPVWYGPFLRFVMSSRESLRGPKPPPDWPDLRAFTWGPP